MSGLVGLEAFVEQNVNARCGHWRFLTQVARRGGSSIQELPNSDDVASRSARGIGGSGE